MRKVIDVGRRAKLPWRGSAESRLPRQPCHAIVDPDLSRSAAHATALREPTSVLVFAIGVAAIAARGDRSNASPA